MRASALVERYRFALEVIANGPEWEPGTKTARLALLPPEVAHEVRAITADIDRLAQSDVENPYTGMSVNEAVEEAREAEPCSDSSTANEVPESEVPEPDDEPEPISLAAIDEELDAELDEAAEDVAEPPRRTREKVGDDGMTDTQRAILALIRELGAVDRGVIIDRVPGVTDDKFKRAMLHLRREGLIESHGPAVATVYKPAPEPTMPDPEPASENVADAGKTDGYTLSGMPAVQAEARRNGNGSDEGRLLDSVQFKPGWSIVQHAGRLELHQDKVAVAMRKLEDEGEVRSRAKDGRVVWMAI